MNGIAGDLEKAGVHIPLTLQDGDSQSPCNDWARGFMRGIELRARSWKPVFDDEQHIQWLIPAMILAHEHDDDPEMRPEPVTAERREEVMVMMTAGVTKIYRYFRTQPFTAPAGRRGPVRTMTVGRNDPCPCGSGSKYKRCCGGVTVH